MAVGGIIKEILPIALLGGIAFIAYKNKDKILGKLGSIGGGGDSGSAADATPTPAAAGPGTTPGAVNPATGLPSGPMDAGGTFGGVQFPNIQAAFPESFQNTLGRSFDPRVGAQLSQLQALGFGPTTGLGSDDLFEGEDEGLGAGILDVDEFGIGEAPFGGGGDFDGDGFGEGNESRRFRGGERGFEDEGFGSILGGEGGGFGGGFGGDRFEDALEGGNRRRDRFGFDRDEGRDFDGFDREGFDRDGFDRDGRDRHGRHRKDKDGRKRHRRDIDGRDGFNLDIDFDEFGRPRHRNTPFHRHGPFFSHSHPKDNFPHSHGYRHQIRHSKNFGRPRRAYAAYSLVGTGVGHNGILIH